MEKEIETLNKEQLVLLDKIKQQYVDLCNMKSPQKVMNSNSFTLPVHRVNP